MSDREWKRTGFGIGELGQTPAITPADDAAAERIQPTPRGDLVRCDCGHTCPRRLVMSTSSGTSCPRCYDRMEDC